MSVLRCGAPLSSTTWTRQGCWTRARCMGTRTSSGPWYISASWGPASPTCSGRAFARSCCMHARRRRCSPLRTRHTLVPAGTCHDLHQRNIYARRSPHSDAHLQYTASYIFKRRLPGVAAINQRVAMFQKQSGLLSWYHHVGFGLTDKGVVIELTSIGNLALRQLDKQDFRLDSIPILDDTTFQIIEETIPEPLGTLGHHMRMRMPMRPCVSLDEHARSCMQEL